MDLLGELDDVSLAPTAETIPRAFLLIDFERWGVFLMERAACFPLPANTLQIRDVSGDVIDDIELLGIFNA